MTRSAASKPPSKFGLKPGSVLGLDNTLKNIMVKLAKDIATAIGDNIGGSEAGFAARIDLKRAPPGMMGPHWVNASILLGPAP